MKKIINKFIVLFTTVLVMGITSCNVVAVHEHTFASTWTYDSTSHWHEATCEDTDEVSEKTDHSFSDWADGIRKCTVCDYEQICEHTFGD